jgi:hypothetical protein
VLARGPVALAAGRVGWWPRALARRRAAGVTVVAPARAGAAVIGVGGQGDQGHGGSCVHTSILGPAAAGQALGPYQSSRAAKLVFDGTTDPCRERAIVGIGAMTDLP